MSSIWQSNCVGAPSASRTSEKCSRAQIVRPAGCSYLRSDENDSISPRSRRRVSCSSCLTSWPLAKSSKLISSSRDSVWPSVSASAWFTQVNRPSRSAKAMPSGDVANALRKRLSASRAASCARRRSLTSRAFTTIAVSPSSEGICRPVASSHSHDPSRHRCRYSMGRMSSPSPSCAPSPSTSWSMSSG